MLRGDSANGTGEASVAVQARADVVLPEHLQPFSRRGPKECLCESRAHAGEKVDRGLRRTCRLQNTLKLLEGRPPDGALSSHLDKHGWKSIVEATEAFQLVDVPGASQWAHADGGLLHLAICLDRVERHGDCCLCGARAKASHGADHRVFLHLLARV